jgi:hypothetical protein
MGRAVRVVLDTLNFAWNAILDTTEINHTVVVLVTAAFVACRDVAVVIAASLLELRLQQRRIPGAFEQMVTRDFDHTPLTGGGGFHFDDCHD